MLPRPDVRRYLSDSGSVVTAEKRYWDTCDWIIRVPGEDEYVVLASEFAAWEEGMLKISDRIF